MDEFQLQIVLERLKQLVGKPIGLPVTQLSELVSVVVIANETNAVKQKFMKAILDSLTKHPQADSDAKEIVKLCSAIASYNKGYIN